MTVLYTTFQHAKTNPLDIFLRFRYDIAGVEKTFEKHITKE
jgi:hypothetical protein